MRLNSWQLTFSFSGQIQTQDMACKDNQLVAGKKGLRWWYEGKQGKHKQVNTWNDQEKEIVDSSMSAAKDGDLETLKAIASQGSVPPLKFDSTH